MDRHARREMASKILAESRLLDILNKYGRPHIVGSYGMDLMACNDIDIDIENEAMSLSKLHCLTGEILSVFKPCWYEAKQETDTKGKRVWFHGFEARLCGELWNFDLWFFDTQTIQEAEAYSATMMRKLAEQESAADVIVDLKTQLMADGRYGFGKYTGQDVYEAVLDKKITDLQTLYQCM